MTDDVVETGNKLYSSSFGTVAVIDDVFDPLDSTRFNKGEIQEFLTGLEDDEQAQEQLAELGIEIELNTTDISSDVLQKLWEHNGDETELGKLCGEKLFVHLIQDLDPVNRFCEYLRADLGLDIITFGTSGNLEELLRKPVRLIFMDRYLGPDITPAQIGSNDKFVSTNGPAQNRSFEWVRNIKNRTTPNEPFVILMSSQDVTPDMRAQFRDATGWLEGMFYFIPKSIFDQKLQLSALLGVFAKSLPVGHKIQSFVDAIEKSLHKVTVEFLRDIRTLSLADYAYIQKLSLLADGHPDGHPLGDYMLWLYGAYLSYLLFENEKTVSTQCSELNRLSLTGHPILQVTPSQHLVKIYKSALFNDHVGDVTRHPLAQQNLSSNFSNENILCGDHVGDLTCQSLMSPPTNPSTISGDGNTLDDLTQPHLQLGDLFVQASSKKVLMVINAQCDLAFTPGIERKIPPERSVILIQGQMQLLSEPIPSSKMRTDLFEYENGSYRILWEIDRVASFAYSSVVSSLKKDGYIRTARLRELYALEIQHAFASNLTRIGRPVSPPVYQPLDVSIFCKEGRNYKCLMNTTRGYAYLAKTREKENCILTFELIKKIMSELSNLGKVTSNYDENWLKLLTPLEIKNEKEKSFASLSVKIRRGKLPEQDYNHRESIFVLVSDVLLEENPDG